MIYFSILVYVVCQHSLGLPLVVLIHVGHEVRSENPNGSGISKLRDLHFVIVLVLELLFLRTCRFECISGVFYMVKIVPSRHSGASCLMS
jgi:hypothetical protein